jgi:phosphoribosyl-ATP pyrophosphohydrolase/phosphoribosyl-AMP cyclohydrolase
MSDILDFLEGIVLDRQAQPTPGSYTHELLTGGLPRMAQKVGEEGVEVVVAALAQEDGRLLEESADLLYHLSVLLVARGLSWEEVAAVLRKRHTSP